MRRRLGLSSVTSSLSGASSVSWTPPVVSVLLHSSRFLPLPYLPVTSSATVRGASAGAAAGGGAGGGVGAWGSWPVSVVGVGLGPGEAAAALGGGGAGGGGGGALAAAGGGGGGAFGGAGGGGAGVVLGAGEPNGSSTAIFTGGG